MIAYKFTKYLSKKFFKVKAHWQVSIFGIGLITSLGLLEGLFLEISLLTFFVFYLTWLSSISENMKGYEEIMQFVNQLRQINKLQPFVESEETTDQVIELVFDKERRSKFLDNLIEAVYTNLPTYLRKPTLYAGSHLVLTGVILTLLYSINSTIIPVLYLIAILPISLLKISVLRFNPIGNFYRISIDGEEGKSTVLVLENNLRDGYVKVLTPEDKIKYFFSNSIRSIEELNTVSEILEDFEE